MSRTHYDVLGVRHDAQTDQIRRAYLDRARELHPDRFVEGTAAERERAHHDMLDVNEAWRVLGHQGRRRRYDIELGAGDSRVATPGVAEFGGEVFFAEEAEPADARARVVQVLPWVLLFAVLGAIFVFTAYAVDDESIGGTGRCVTVEASGDTADSDCAAPGARRVVQQVPANAPCPDGTERVPVGAATALCLEV